MRRSAPLVVVTPVTVEDEVEAVESVALALRAAPTPVVVALDVAGGPVQLWSTAVRVHV